MEKVTCSPPRSLQRSPHVQLHLTDVFMPTSWRKQFNSASQAQRNLLNQGSITSCFVLKGVSCNSSEN